MLKKIYVDNFRCLVNFEIHLDNLNLLAGLNGSGKSALFDAVYGVRQVVVTTARVHEVFPEAGLTSWIRKSSQTVELEVQESDDIYTYTLTLDLDRDSGKLCVAFEGLQLNGNPLFAFENGEVQLYYDDHTPGPAYSFDTSISALSTVAPRKGNQHVTWFKEWFASLLVLTLQPRMMSAESLGESEWLNRDGTNFASWYRFLSQEHQDKTIALTEQLRETILGFYAFKLQQSGKQRVLKIGFTAEGERNEPLYFDFQQISDGQRILIVLYALLVAIKDLGYTVFLDEPENYVSLPEIQPWLMSLQDICMDEEAQAVLISHHPELMDYLGGAYGRWFERFPLGPARVKPFPHRLDQDLKMSEQIARGWTE